MTRRSLVATFVAVVLTGAAGPLPARAETPAGAITWTVDHDAKTITALVRLHIYSGCSGNPFGTAENQAKACRGRGSQVTQFLADKIKQKIESVWNKPYHYRCYRLVAIVDIKLAPDPDHIDPDRLGVRIDPSAVHVRSWVDADPYSDTWSSNDPADRVNPRNDSEYETTWTQEAQDSYSRTYAHEFGHLLGLDDTYVEGTWETKPGAPSDLMSGDSTTIDQSNIDRVVERNADRLYDTAGNPVELEDLACEPVFQVKLIAEQREYGSSHLQASLVARPCSREPFTSSTLQNLAVTSAAPTEVRLIEDAAYAPLGYLLEPTFDALTAANGMSGGGRSAEAVGLFDVPIDVQVSRANSRPASGDIPPLLDVGETPCAQGGGTPPRPDCGARHYSTYVAVVQHGRSEAWLVASSLPTVLKDLGYSMPRLERLYRNCAGPTPWPGAFTSEADTRFIRGTMPSLADMKKVWTAWQIEGTAGTLEINGDAVLDTVQPGRLNDSHFQWDLILCPVNRAGVAAPGCS